MYKNSFVHYVTKIVVDIIFYGGIVACFFIPFFIKWWTGLEYLNKISIFLNTVLFLSAVCALYIIWQLKKIFKTLLGGNPFVLDNVSCLRKMAVASFLISILYIIKDIFFFTMSTTIIVTAFGVAALFCLTLKDVFKQAVYYKEENDGVI